MENEDSYYVVITVYMISLPSKKKQKGQPKEKLSKNQKKYNRLNHVVQNVEKRSHPKKLITQEVIENTLSYLKLPNDK